MATIELWRGDLMRNLAAFRDVRDHLSARYHLAPQAESALETSATAAR